MLSGNIDAIALGMPGSALSDMSLSDADLPHVQQMVSDSLDACCMFKRQARVPQPAPSGPLNIPNPFAEHQDDLEEGTSACNALCAERPIVGKAQPTCR